MSRMPPWRSRTRWTWISSVRGGRTGCAARTPTCARACPSQNAERNFYTQRSGVQQHAEVAQIVARGARDDGIPEAVEKRVGIAAGEKGFRVEPHRMCPAKRLRV